MSETLPSIRSRTHLFLNTPMYTCRANSAKTIRQKMVSVITSANCLIECNSAFMIVFRPMGTNKKHPVHTGWQLASRSFVRNASSWCSAYFIITSTMVTTAVIYFYEDCVESIQPFWISRELVKWPWCNLAASQRRPYCAFVNSHSPVGLVSRQWDAVDWARVQGCW